MYTFTLGYILYIATQIIRELVFRKGIEAKSFSRGSHDKGTSILNGILLFTLAILPLILIYFNLGFIEASIFIGIIGIASMLVGIAIHFIAIKTLGEFYTRTLTITQRHSLITTGIYRHIRNPGYLGSILIGLGLGLTSYNWLMMLMVVVLLSVAYWYRISSEEKMLTKQFDKVYEDYKKQSWALVPYLI